MTSATGMTADRSLAWDWYDGKVPVNVHIADLAYVETTFSFYLFRSERPDAITIKDGASVYLGTMFDVGTQGRVAIGEYTLVNGARIVCDDAVIIEDYALLSWNVVLMDTYRVPLDPDARRAAIMRVPETEPRRLDGNVAARPLRICRGAWLGFDCCVMPGVTIGEGAIVGARSVVMSDVAPFTIVAGNPARLIRRLTEAEMADGR
jgi:acetyltransferase-like isoleucine patch superfamily enzyme